ncbi:MAG: acetolactate synthase [Porticoccaceae bacterium]|nr:MAG: acetolactate synthase [Porticoccaceae bacterium]
MHRERDATCGKMPVMDDRARRREEPLERAAQTGADWLVAALGAAGVEYLFGVPGGAVEPLVDALARAERRGGPRLVVARHESGAAWMAESYYQATGRLGVCFATTGPGATNLATGAASAAANGSPLLVLTGQTPLPTFGRTAFQESSCTGIDVVALFAPLTRYNSLVSHPAQLPWKLAAAVRRAFHHPRGPVHLSLPFDVLAAPPVEPVPAPPGSAVHFFDGEAVRQLAVRLAAARRPVLVAGGPWAAEEDALAKLAEHLDAPLLATAAGRCAVDAAHPRFAGVVGFAGHPSARRLLVDPEVDAVLFAGGPLSEWAADGWDERLLAGPRLIHLSPDPEHFSASPTAGLQVLGTPAAVCAELLGLLPRRRGAARADRVEMADPAAMAARTSPLRPEWLMAELARRCPPDSLFLADAGNALAWATHYLLAPGKGPRGTGGSLRALLDFAAMGWAIGGAVGTALGARGRPVVCLTGDGAFLMSGQEITVAVQERLPVLFVILHDGALGMVRHGQRLTGAESHGWALPEVDFAAWGEALGIPGLRIRAPEDLEAVDFAALARRPGPALLDVRVDPLACPPMEMRGRTLRRARA